MQRTMIHVAWSNGRWRVTESGSRTAITYASRAAGVRASLLDLDSRVLDELRREFLRGALV